MNATVTKSAKKTVAAKNPGKTAAKPTKITKTKDSGKTGASTLKRVATKLAKKATTSLKSAVKSVKATVKLGAKPIAKSAAKLPAKTTVKATAKTSVQSAAKPAIAKKAQASSKTTGVAKKRAPSAVKAPVAKKSAVKSAVGKAADLTGKRLENSASDLSKSTADMSSNKAGVRSTDRIEKPVVPKVSEVATKPMKSTPAIVTDGALLSEAQILKMSEKDYMNAAQLAFFKARLQQLEKDLLKNAGETTEHLRETVLVPDPADRATIEEEHALELRTRDRERKLLKKVQQSIASIDSGDYGWCEETGEPIGIPRLLARPTATLSLEAQQRRELKQKLYGD
jgi:DnaK suppressor protein